jgi:phospholipase C
MADGFPQIRHVVVLMLENRSFDHMLGAVPGVNGVSANWTNSDGQNTYAQTALSWRDPLAREVKPDPKHETPNVLRQLADDNGGFVLDYARTYPDSTSAQRHKIMSYYPLGSLGPLHVLARTFAVCQRWHASVPGPTWTNRLFAMSGTSLGRVRMPGPPNYGQPSVFLRLFQANRVARVYYGDVPLALLLDDQRVGVPELGYDAKSTYYPMSMFKYHATVRENRFPHFTFIEPAYTLFANDDHPPHDPIRGQRLVAEVYNALRANQRLWRSTLLVILYDEHGGFADHVSPPRAEPPDEHQEEYTFDRLGVRVPAVFVSPWLAPQICDEVFDHTSLLRALTEKWGLGPLGARTAKAADVFAALQKTAAPREDTPAALDPDMAPPVPHDAPNTDHQAAAMQLAEDLDATPGLTPRERTDNFLGRAAPAGVEAP